jgi:hypothetical protein
MTQIPSNNVEVVKLNLNQAHRHLCTFLSPCVGVDGFATMETANFLYSLYLMVPSSLLTIYLYIPTTRSMGNYQELSTKYVLDYFLL